MADLNLIRSPVEPDEDYIAGAGVLWDLPLELTVMILSFASVLDLPWIRAASRYMRDVVEMACESRGITGDALTKTWHGAIMSVGRTEEALKWWMPHEKRN